MGRCTDYGKSDPINTNPFHLPGFEIESVECKAPNLPVDWLLRLHPDAKELKRKTQDTDQAN